MFFNEFELVKYESNNSKTTFILKILINDIKNLDELKKNLSSELQNLEMNYYFSNPVY